MKIVLITGGAYSIPTMNYLASQNQLHSVVTIGPANKNNITIALNAERLNLPFKRFEKSEMLSGFKDWLKDARASMALVFGCGYKIPAELFSIPMLGFYNIHFSLLPAYRGNTPVFWQIKNGETKSGVTMHRMTADFDKGPILSQNELAVHTGETSGLLTSRLASQSVSLIAMELEKFNQGKMPPPLEQDESKATQIHTPTINDLVINWEKYSAQQITNLVNAANPEYEGAVTQLRGQPFRIIEVGPVNITNPSKIEPGTIVHSDITYGVIVACKDMEYLRITVARLNEGIFSGFRLAAMGIAAGERFEGAAGLQSVMVK